MMSLELNWKDLESLEGREKPFVESEGEPEKLIQKFPKSSKIFLFSPEKALPDEGSIDSEE